MPVRPLFVTRKFPPSVGGMETLAAGVWRSLDLHSGAALIAHGGGNRALLWWLPYAVCRVFMQLVRHRVDFVLAGDALTYAVLFPVLRTFDVQNATMVVGLDVTHDNALYRAVVHRALRRAPRVIAISGATALAVRSVGVPPDRVGVVRLGISAPHVTSHDRTDAGTELRRRYDLTDGTVVLLTLGRLVRRKGVRWFVENVVPGLPSNVIYIVAGDGPERELIRTAAIASAVDGRVMLVGRVEDDTRELLLRGADLFVQPNIRVTGDIEGFGLVILEAAMRGTPTVASAVDGILDAVVDNETGLLLPAEEPHVWTERLRGLTSDVSRLRDLGAQFQVRARETYSEQEMARQLLAEIERAT